MENIRNASAEELASLIDEKLCLLERNILHRIATTKLKLSVEIKDDKSKRYIRKLIEDYYEKDILENDDVEESDKKYRLIE